MTRLSLCLRTGVPGAAALAATKITWGSVVYYVTTETADLVIESATGIPIILGTGDIAEWIGKGLLKRGSKAGTYYLTKTGKEVADKLADKAKQAAEDKAKREAAEKLAKQSPDCPQPKESGLHIEPPELTDARKAEADPELQKVTEYFTNPPKAKNAPKTVAKFTTTQLEKKWKHAVDFGITTTKRNPTTLAEYQAAITRHIDDMDTVIKGTYGWVENSVVHFNPKTNIAVVLDDAGNFITGWKLKPGTPQFEKYINDGFLK